VRRLIGYRALRFADDAKTLGIYVSAPRRT